MSLPDNTLSFSAKVLYVIKNIPSGRVLSYGRVAALAGDYRASRQVVRILHSSSKKHSLPWHRIINSAGKISLPGPDAYYRQKSLLEAEGVEFSSNDMIDLKKYLWSINFIDDI